MRGNIIHVNVVNLQLPNSDTMWSYIYILYNALLMSKLKQLKKALSFSISLSLSDIMRGHENYQTYMLVGKINCIWSTQDTEITRG